MKYVTQLMVNDYKIKTFDFAGYVIHNKQDLSFHHLIIPRRLGGTETKENGAILVQKTSHDYLHRIEQIDYDVFAEITSEMIDENIKGRLDIDNLKRIRDLLEYFEREYSNYSTKKGKPVIKESYVRERIKL